MDAVTLAAAQAAAAKRYGSAVRPTVVNRKNLQRFSDALKTKACPVVTVLGNSISWGVGSDGTSATTAGFWETYRQSAWPTQARKRLALLRGQLPAENLILLDAYSGYATLGGTAAYSQTIGPFGGYGSLVNDATRGGGVSLPDSTATINIPNTKTGRFTDLDILYWGTTAGVSGGFDPTVLIDGGSVRTGGTASSGNLTVATVTGLTDAAHSITIQGTGTNPTWIVGVVPRRSTGVVVNRMAAPGIDINQVLGQSAWTSAQRTRQADAAVLAGYSDLVVISLTANEFYHQLDLTTHLSSLTTVVNRATGAGACVLLMGDPAAPNEETASPIKGSQYRANMISLSNSNGNVAYADFNAIFGDRSTAQTAGLWSANGSVHPSLEGHRRMADFFLDQVLPLPTI